MKARAACLVFFAVSSARAVCFAGTFDDRGVYVRDPDAVVFEAFDEPTRYSPPDVETACIAEHFIVVTDPDAAFEGDNYVNVTAPQQCAENFVVLDLPAGAAAYKATLWMRHGGAGARIVVEYVDGTSVQARMAPTGRVTSDGWVELASNAVSIDNARAPNVYLRFTDFAEDAGVDLDALELVPAGDFRDAPSCDGISDPVCGEDAICLGGQCRIGELSVPPLPGPEIKDEVVDALEFKLKTFFGGKHTRANDLPVAIATLESLRDAETPWQFWNGWATAIHQLHDWHTNANGSIGQGGSTRGRLNACFIEGDADLSHDVLPSDPKYKDILVSHVGTADNANLVAGDRLVAVDGLHPIEWARQLYDVNWGYHVACDDNTFQDFAEAMDGLILQFAKDFSVIHCDAATNTCSDVVETIAVSSLPEGGGGQNVACDNRPTYHLGANSPGPNHAVYYDFFQGPIDGTTPDEKIFGMVWDTLYGGGDPNGYVNSILRGAVTNWKQNARGVILDHRAGNGGTLDAPEYLTQLVRPQEVLAVTLMPIETAGFDGPATPSDGMLLFNRSKIDVPYTVGAPDYDPNLPVALITHRDGSASDYLPLGIKGSPKAKLFGPGPTAGAFSTFIQFAYWGGISFQFASGDTITNLGEAQIGHGVVPDFIVDQKQSDLLHGVDTIHEAALAWVRQELKP